jgi:hypothetical protein
LKNSSGGGQFNSIAFENKMPKPTQAHTTK